MDDVYLLKVIELIKDRCALVSDFYPQAKFFFESPATLDKEAVLAKWDADKKDFFGALARAYREIPQFSVEEVETVFKNLAAEKKIKVGDLQMIYRVMLVGSKMGPGVFIITEAIGKNESIKRIEKAMESFSS